jgi:hypothetical protein
MSFIGEGPRVNRTEFALQVIVYADEYVETVKAKIY